MLPDNLQTTQASASEGGIHTMASIGLPAHFG
jgi:hypothetical protein